MPERRVAALARAEWNEKMKIGPVDLDREVLIIAEIGNNHEGDFAFARDMIGEAARAGAQAVKFQTIVPDKLVAPSLKEAREMLTKFQFSYEQFADLKKIADDEGVTFLSTPFDIESVQFLDSLVPAFKIASGDNDFWPLIEATARTGKPILLSTGMADLDGIRKARGVIENVWNQNGIQQELIVLHCVSLYPTPPEAANLASIPYLAEQLGLRIGFSDHTLGIDAAVLAVALGAGVIEKHFTLDKNFSDFPDHAISMDPADLKKLTGKIPQARAMLGRRDAFVEESEKEIAKVARRSIAAGRDLKSGAEIRMEDLDWLRPGGGLPPGEEGRVVGKRLTRDVSKGNFLRPEDVS